MIQKKSFHKETHLANRHINHSVMYIKGSMWWTFWKIREHGLSKWWKLPSVTMNEKNHTCTTCWHYTIYEKLAHTNQKTVTRIPDILTMCFATWGTVFSSKPPNIAPSNWTASWWIHKQYECQHFDWFYESLRSIKRQILVKFR